MKFTYESYRKLIDLLRLNGYFFVDYESYKKYDKCVIMRHDIDTSPEKALRLAKLEAEEGISSTYFALLSSQFYNIAAKETKKILLQISDLGHKIGLHFDEMNYAEFDRDKIESYINNEVWIMNQILPIEIKAVSMHRPSRQTLEADYDLNHVVNSYGKIFFKDFKYVSDSRRRWREDVEDIVKSCKYKRLHILTHAFWYNEVEIDLKTTLSEFIFSGNIARYEIFERNFTDLNSVISKEVMQCLKK